MKELVLGASGFIGKAYVDSSKSNPLTPSSKEVDILNPNSLENYFKRYPNIDVVIDFAAFTNTKAARDQKEQKEESEVWKTNVSGAENVAKFCKLHNIFLIYISTDNVFFDRVGPSNEEGAPANDGSVDWYGHTKLRAEEVIKEVGPRFAIVRIAYPFGNPDAFDKDLCMKIVSTMKAGYGLFDDQHFTPTYIPQALEVIKKISLKQKEGVFHAVCSDLTTPYKIGLYLKKILDLPFEVKKGSLTYYEKEKGKSTLAQNGGLLTPKTSEVLGVDFLSSEDALNKERQNYKSHLPQILE